MAGLGTAGVGIMLARLLGPRAFGMYAVAYLALRLLVHLNGLGAHLAVVRWPGDPRLVAPTAATIAFVSSLVLYGACYLVAPGYVAAMGAPAAAGVVRVLCLVLVVDGLAAGPAGLAQRDPGRRLRRAAGQVNVWSGAILTAVLAVAGLGAMSLAVGRLAGCLASLAVMVAFSPWRLRFGFRRGTARDLVCFGLPLAGPGLVTFAVISAGQFAVGRLLGVTALGYFVLASNVSNWPVAGFSRPVRDAAPAALARLRHDPPAMRRAFLSVTGLLGAAALPVCLAISGLARPLTGFVYGGRWLPAAPALAWLAVLAALQIVFELSYGYLAACGLPRTLFTLQLVWLAVLVPALVAGTLTGGIAGAAGAELAVAAGLALPWHLWELRRTGIGGRALAGRLRRPVAGAAVAGLAGLAVSRFLAGPLAALLAGGAVMGLVLALLLARRRADLAGLLLPARRGAALLAAGDQAAGNQAAGNQAAGNQAAGNQAAAGPVPAGLAAAAGLTPVAGVAGPARGAAAGPVAGPARVPGGPARRWDSADGDPASRWAEGVRDPGEGLAGAAEDSGDGWAGAVGDPASGWAGAAGGPEDGWAAAPGGPGDDWAEDGWAEDGWAEDGWAEDGWAEAGDPGDGWAAAAGGSAGSRPGAGSGAGGDRQQAPAAFRPPVPWPGLPLWADTTGPLPLCRDLTGMELPPPSAGLPPAGPATGPLPPLYRATARALGWEPPRAPAQPDGRSPRDRDHRSGHPPWPDPAWWPAHDRRASDGGSRRPAGPEAQPRTPADRASADWPREGRAAADRAREGRASADWHRGDRSLDDRPPDDRPPDDRPPDDWGPDDWLPDDWHPDRWDPGRQAGSR